jgi:hypothetical protein
MTLLFVMALLYVWREIVRTTMSWMAIEIVGDRVVEERKDARL